MLKRIAIATVAALFVSSAVYGQAVTTVQTVQIEMVPGGGLVIMGIKDDGTVFEMVTIGVNGSVVIGDKYSPSAAAKAFWTGMGYKKACK